MSKEEKRLADELARWLDGDRPVPAEDPTARAVARTAVLLVDALAPTPLHPVTRARLYERALAQARPGQITISWADALEDPIGELWRLSRQLPPGAWLGVGAAVAAVALLGVAVLRQRAEA